MTDRLPLPDAAAMTPQQKAAADALIAGPRKGVYGPFLPLLRSPVLLERVASVGEYLRFDSVLDARIRELVTCASARHVSNQFEWHMHAPLAVKAGVNPGAIEALRVGARPQGLATDEQAALAAFDEQGVVELTTLVGYFVMVSWLMNAAHTPAGAQGAPLEPFPQ